MNTTRIKNIPGAKQSLVERYNCGPVKLSGDRQKFIHLVDRGIADNLGLRGPAERAIQLEESVMTPQATVKIPRRLPDGTHVLLRPVMPEDRERIQNGMAALSPRSRYLRFFTSASRLSDEQLRYFSEVDQCNHVAWIALDSSVRTYPGLGVARFIRIKEEPTVAEVALTVIDAYQRKGLGTILLALLYLVAETQGFLTLRAAVIGENTTMLKWLHNLGAAGSCERGEYRLNLTVHRDLTCLPQTPSGEKFKHAIEALQTAFHEHHTYEKHS